MQIFVSYNMLSHLYTYFMLISCTSCYSKYLINSADLKPNGRKVQCANCGNQWFQENIPNQEEEMLDSVEVDKNIDTNFSSQHKKKHIPNLPSTYVKEQKVSVINSILVIMFIIILILGFWIFQNYEINDFILLKFYFDEFNFNLKLIFDDIAKIIHKIFN